MNMLIQLKARLFFSLAFMIGISWLSSLRAAVLTGVDPTIISVGTGVDISYLVIDESTLYSTPLEFVYHYTYDSTTPLTGYDLISAITNASSSGLGATTPYISNWGAHTMDAFSYAGNTVAGTPFSPSNTTGVYWSLFEVGGQEAGSIVSIPSNSWTIAGVGLDGRIITPGSWDGWTISSYTDGGWTTVDTSPSVAITAVPEPATIPLTLLSMATLFLFTRWKPTAPKEII